ncbi:hypothetical protein [Streptomyces sp. NPDC096153]|uniref:hypothetical protein n=1 Tax=Streptomyces sp. NPDC096153 TaxID=3155548 RepID=UPI0033340136
MAFEQAGGTYDSYIGSAVTEPLAAHSDPGRAAVATDALTAAAVAELATVEAEALALGPGNEPQYARTRAVTRVLARIPAFLPQAPVDSSDLVSAEAALSGRLSGPDLALAAQSAASSVLASCPTAFETAVRLTLLPSTPLHDELMFIRSIQIFEGLYRQVAGDVAEAIKAIGAVDIESACTLLADGAARIEATPMLYRVLTTMPRAAFAVIRDNTQGRSAIQSRWYHQVQALCAAPTPPEGVAGLPTPEISGPTLQDVYATSELAMPAAQHRRLTTAMRRLDRAWSAMKRNHWGLTVKIIGSVPGTGGTTGASYLRTSSEAPLFPLLRQQDSSVREGV